MESFLIPLYQKWESVNVFVVNITGKIALRDSVGVWEITFLCHAWNTEYMGNYKAIILHESDEYQ